MRIEWLNDARTYARVSRGWLWWRRVAVLFRCDKSSSEYIYWAYEVSHRYTSRRIDAVLERKRNWYVADWRKIGDGAPLPTMHTVKDGGHASG